MNSQGRCLSCRAAWQKAWYAKNGRVPSSNKPGRKRIDQSPDALAMTNPRTSHIRRYGITPSQYVDLLAAQGGKCAICRTDSAGGPTKNNTWMIDHDHATGAVRGLLCCRCNFVLGYAKDSVEVLKAAIEYLNPGR